MDGSKEAAEAFLTSLLSKTLRITTTDTRLFVGEFKCTDTDRNIILSRTYEYRLPSPPSIPASHPTASTSPTASSSSETNPEKVTLDMASRYLGLVVVPGEFITKIEVEEFASQVQSTGSQYAAFSTKSEVTEPGNMLE